MPARSRSGAERNRFPPVAESLRLAALKQFRTGSRFPLLLELPYGMPMHTVFSNDGNFCSLS